MKPKTHQFVTTEDEALSALRTLKSLRDGALLMNNEVFYSEFVDVD